MAAPARYHLLPEENRQSIDSVRDDERLLGAVGEEPNLPNPPKRTLKFSYHPTFILRLLVLILAILGLIFFLLVSSHPRVIPAIVFICLLILRNTLIVFQHRIGRFIRIQIEFSEASTTSTTSSPKPPKWFKRSRIQLAIDLLLAVALLITVSVGYNNGHGSWYNRWNSIPGCVLSWIAIPLHLLSAIDMGNPNRFTIKSTLTIGTGDEPAKKVNVLPRTYRDVEAEPIQKPGKNAQLYSADD